MPAEAASVRSTAGTVTVRRGMAVWTSAHAVDDFFQGLVPAALPCFALERGYSYLQISGLALAATVGSAVPQVLIGVIADRRALIWMSPTGLAVAGTGAGAAGLLPGYGAVWLALLISGLGVAMFHPPAGRDARTAAGSSAKAMSCFAAGGSAGFFLAPALATPALHAWGVEATAMFIAPALLMSAVLMRHQRRQRTAVASRPRFAGTDQPRMFALLTAVEVIRSTVSFGINTFIALYWIGHLGASPSLAGLALTLQLVGGFCGTLIGGHLGDRYGLVRTVQIGNALLVPSIAALLLCRDPHLALLFAMLTGTVTSLPFAVLIKLGQDYLPTCPGTASGVTLGLAVSAGGLLMPVLGALADHAGTQSVFVVLACVPALALVLSAALQEPANGRVQSTLGITASP